MADRDDLSDNVHLVWGKAGDLSNGWLPLWRHLADSADVAGRLWDLWLSAAVKSRIGQEFSRSESDGRRLVRWLAGIHDIGKATPTFAFQVRPLADRMRDYGFTFDPQVKADRRYAPHATAGHLLVTDWLGRRHGWERWEAASFAVVVGGHHGVPPSDNDLDVLRSHPHLLGVDGLWPGVRDELLDWMARRVGADERLSVWRSVEVSQPVQALLTAIVIVADWIASNEELFPYEAGEVSDFNRVDEAWQSLDLPTPWRAVDVTLGNEALYASRFTLPADARPYPVQVAVAEAARRMPVPGLLIVEAPMGEGKTEAALAAVEVLASRTGAGGCFVALPTRATSDAMFPRVLSWLDRLPDADVDRGSRDVVLAHGKAALNREFSQLYWRASARTPGVSDGGPSIAVHRWLAGRKRTTLSSFGIGTIDQLLFAALKSRHVVLRHLGLASKVVVIDEAHAYDVYMSSYLDRALLWLGAYGAPVVVLSATLPASRRAEMMEAYDEGRLGPPPSTRPRPWTAAPADSDPYQAVRKDQRYPLLTVSGTDRRPDTYTCAGSGRDLSVRLAPHDDDPCVLAETLQDELVDGGCVLVVANTVARVLETASVLRTRLGPDVAVSVAHSRFMAPDREVKDRWLRDTFGPPAYLAKLGRTRPRCHVVVASQVAEQSLDIDFDLLVTDLAPVDLMLQRIGRLHRHARPDRPRRLAEPRCLIRGADWTAVPPTPVSGTIRVYGPSAVLRAAAVILPHLDEGQPLAIPDDISPLVQAAYSEEPVGPETWQPALAEAAKTEMDRQHRQRERAETFRLGPVRGAGQPLIGWLTAATGDVDSGGGDDARGRAHVRDDSAESLDVLVLVRRDGQLVTPPWLVSDGATAVPTDFAPPPWLARIIASCSLSLPKMMTSRSLDQLIAELEQRNSFAAWQDNPWLGGELILDLDQQGHAQLGDFGLEYDPDDGLRVSRHAQTL